MEELYKQILLEHFGQAMFLPVGSSVTYDAMYWMGQGDMQYATVFAMIGAALGCTVNWMFGQILAFIRLQNNRFFSDERYGKISTYVRRFGIVLLPFYWVPMGGLLIVAAGFFGVRWWIMLPLVIAGGIIHMMYAYPPLAS